jgi:hypothetical protein
MAVNQTAHLEKHIKHCSYFGFTSVEQKALNILDDRTTNSFRNPHINSWIAFDNALLPPQNRSRLTSQEKLDWRIRQHLFIARLDLDLLYPTPLLPLTDGNDPVSAREIYQRQFQPLVALHTTPWMKVIQPHWSIRTFPNVDIRNIICLFTGHTHLMAHNPNIAPDAADRVCDICMVAGHGLHDGTAHHLLNGCCIPALTRLREHLDQTATQLCHQLNVYWQQATNNHLTTPFHWTPFATNRRHWTAAIALSEDAPCFTTARNQTNSSNYSDRLWSPIIKHIAAYVTKAIHIHRQHHQLTRKIRTNTLTWKQSIETQTHTHGYTTRHHTTFLSD